MIAIYENIYEITTKHECSFKNPEPEPSRKTTFVSKVVSSKMRKLTQDHNKIEIQRYHQHQRTGNGRDNEK